MEVPEAFHPQTLYEQTLSENGIYRKGFLSSLEELLHEEALSAKHYVLNAKG